jgi:hypothetical protein
VLLFDIAGTVRIDCPSLEAAAESLCAILASEGGSNIKISDNTITFDGETGRMSGNKLNNIAIGKIELRRDGGSFELAYAINIDRWNLIVSAGASIFGFFILIVDGTSAFLIFGTGILALTLASTFVIRWRFRRLLRQAMGMHLRILS